MVIQHFFCIFAKKKHMEEKAFTGENIVKALESLFISDRFMQWTGPGTDLYGFAQGQAGFWRDGDKLNVTSGRGAYEIPIGGWVVKAPDGSIHAFGDGVKFVPYEELTRSASKTREVEDDGVEIKINKATNGPDTFYYPEDPFENEVVMEGNATSLRRKLDKNGNPILKKGCYTTARNWGNTYEYEGAHDNPVDSTKKPVNDWSRKFIKEVDKWKK